MPKPTVISHHQGYGAVVSPIQSSLLEGITNAIERIEDDVARLVDVQTFQGLQDGPEEDDWEAVILVRIMAVDFTIGHPVVVAVATFTKAGVALDSHDSVLINAIRESIELAAATSPDYDAVVFDKKDFRHMHHKKQHQTEAGE